MTGVKKISLTFMILAFIFLLGVLFSHDDSKEHEDMFFFPLDIPLTAEDEAWIENHPVIRVAGPLNLPPFFWSDDEGKTAGMGSDYVHIILENLGMEVDFVSNLPWPEVLERTKNKELDLIAISAKSADREKYLLFSDPSISSPLVILSRNDSPFISGLSDLEGMAVAVVKNNITTDWLARDGIAITPVEVSTPTEGLEALSLGRAEAYIGNLAATTYIIADKKLTNVKVAAPTEYGYYDFHMAVRNDWPELVSLLNKGLDTMTASQKSQISNNWISVRYDHGITRQDVLGVVFYMAVATGFLLLVSMLWNRRLKKEIIMRRKTEDSLRSALEEITNLEGLLPICAGCKSIRNDKGYWQDVEHYLGEHSDLSFSHSLCPDCMKKYFGDQKWFDKVENSDKKESEDP